MEAYQEAKLSNATELANQIPPGVSIQPIFVIEATYTADAAERRPAVRAEHLTRIAKLIRDGVIIEAGGCLDLSTAIVLLHAASEEAALDIMRNDVYITAGVFTDLRVRPFGRVVPID